MSDRNRNRFRVCSGVWGNGKQRGARRACKNRISAINEFLVVICAVIIRISEGGGVRIVEVREVRFPPCVWDTVACRRIDASGGETVELDDAWTVVTSAGVPLLELRPKILGIDGWD